MTMYDHSRDVRDVQTSPAPRTLSAPNWLSTEHAGCGLVALAALALWHLRVAGSLPLATLCLYAAMVATWLAFGHALARVLARSLDSALGAPQQLLLGFFCANTLAFLLALLSPLGLVLNAIAVSALGAASVVLARRWAPRTVHPAATPWPGILACLVSALAATWWCSDMQPPFVQLGDALVLQTWRDTIIHSRILGMFALSHGMGTLQDIRLAGVHAPVYHFASYVTPSTLTLLSNLRAFDVYASFQLPFGIFLTGLAAHALLMPLFGRWAALAGCIAVVALPDAFLQGFGNRYLSYFFMTQVNLGMLYGIATAAIAWLFVMHGTRQGKLGLVMFGYAWLLACLFYKAHLFVANAYLLLLYPCLFMTRFGRSARLLVWAVCTAVFVAVIWYSQRILSIPLIKLDFSGVSVYLVNVLQNLDPGAWKDLYTRFFLAEQHGRASQALAFIAMLALSTLGLWLPVAALLLAAGRRRWPLAVRMFPLLVVANYLVMATGLALDTHEVGTVDELQNRPLVWAYFVLAAWCAAAAWHYCWGAGLPASRPARAALLAGAALASLWPMRLGHELQTFPARAGHAHYADFNAIPACLASSAQFIRAHSGLGDVVQDSLNDPRFHVTALAERQAYVADGGLMRRNDEIDARVTAMRGALDGDAAQLGAFLRLHAIKWLLWEGEPTGAWSTSLPPAYDCGKYRVFATPQAALLP